jgi:ubiquinone/menaquinone biosynthesis C-methylase UbiE
MSSFRTRLLGPTLWGDVNIDTAAAVDETSGVEWGDVTDLSHYPDRHFGAAIASHVLEHVDDPDAALRELYRVTRGPVFVVLPSWWAPHTWLYLDHRWFISPSGVRLRLWGAGS